MPITPKAGSLFHAETQTALADGFEWQGKPYRSLSQIARIMTGTRWNGLVFFGVKQNGSNSRKAGDAKPVRRRAPNA